MKPQIALVGNPNVGKSTIFNTLTGLHQHTGNWAGVTVTCTYGKFSFDETEYSIVDLPGIYSFDIRSDEEKITRQYVLEGEFDFLFLICDATCLERGLHLLEQAAELIKKRTDPIQIILCVNLCDEASKKGIHINFEQLQETLKIPVVPCRAREKDGLNELKKILSTIYKNNDCDCPQHLRKYQPQPNPFSPETIVIQTVQYTKSNYRQREEQLDRFFTGKFTGSLCMILLLFIVFWITIIGANLPSQLLWNLFFRLENLLVQTASGLGAPDWFISISIYGIYRVIAWIVSVMLPPMAIFFPLFTLLEDLGYLPRIAYNMDGAFQKCSACGKQCLTMAMGLGCNAAGVTGCRIIDSPRERLLAILTNSFVPCNGRFPLLITMITLGIMQLNTEIQSHLLLSPLITSLVTAFTLTLFILSGILATLGVSWILSHTLLKGVPSSFTLELPPYRPPQIKQIIIRSIFDRTIFVLGRAVFAAAPAGLLIWLMANISIHDQTLLFWSSNFLNPLGEFMGLDGMILMAFILGFPANEIILPIILMAYLQTGCLTNMDDTTALFSLLSSNGWTLKTYLCMAVFSLFHWPCATTCLTIKKETGSLHWTVIAFCLPMFLGIFLCIIASLLLGI